MKYRMNHCVRFSEVSSNQHAGIAQLINYFQDCSSFHSNSLGVGFDYLAKNHRAWLMSGWQIEVDRFPVFGEEITIETWPYDWKGVYGFRNFHIIDSNNHEIVRANSIWVHMDTKEGKPLRYDGKEVDLYGTEPKLDMTYYPRKIRAPKTFTQAEPFAVIRSYIDTYQHMNNAQYVSLAEEYLPEDFDIHSLRVYYKQAAVAGDVIYPRITADENTYTIQLCREDGDPYAIISFS
ncbi:MAG: thioesterase [Lachnospiraceae bacterium]|nr:thioesterase [Lachnospiraceae bacterium]